MNNRRMHFREFDEAYVVSDLHIGGAPGGQMFASSARFTEFVGYLVRRLSTIRKAKKAAGEGDPRMLLVINGDFVDFLAEADDFKAGRSSRYFLANGAEDTLQRILLNNDRFPAVTKALQDFVSKNGTHLVVILGNHDLELTLPNCREEFLNILTEGDRRRRSGVELCFEGWGYRFQVGGQKALCLHGNETDIFNFTRYDELDRIQRELTIHGRSEFGEQWIPSAGTQFVIDAVNPLKNDHPFVDLMHPLLWLVPTVLGAINPGNIRFGDEAAEMGVRAVVNEKLRPASQRRMLSGAVLGTNVSGRSDTDADIFYEVENALREGRIDDLIQRGRQSDRQTLGLWDSVRNSVRAFCKSTVDLAVTAVNALDEKKEQLHREMVRRLLSQAVEDQLDSPLELAGDDRGMEAAIGAEYDVIFAGHTHHRRLAQRVSGQGIHVNTGTWADRMTLLTSDVSDSGRFAKIYKALMSSKRSLLTDPALGLVRRDCTVGVLGTLPGQTGVSVAIGSVPEGRSNRFDPEFSEPLN